MSDFPKKNKEQILREFKDNLQKKYLEEYINDNDWLCEVIHLVLVVGIDHLNNYNDDSELMFILNAITESFSEEVLYFAKQYIRLTTQFIVLGDGKELSIIKKKNIPRKISNRSIIFHKFVIAYEERKKEIKIQEYVNENNSHLKTIGLGVESSIKIPSVKNHEVKIDKNTLNKGKKKIKHIIYTPGWSLKDELE